MLILQLLKLNIFLQEDRMTICTILMEEREKTDDRNTREYPDKLYDKHNKLQMYVIICVSINTWPLRKCKTFKDCT